MTQDELILQRTKIMKPFGSSNARRWRPVPVQESVVEEPGNLETRAYCSDIVPIKVRGAYMMRYLSRMVMKIRIKAIAVIEVGISVAMIVAKEVDPELFDICKRWSEF